MHTKRFLAGVAALALVGGCAGQIKRLEPGLELRAAAQHLGEAQQAGFTLELTGSADALMAEAKKDQEKDKDAGPWTDDDTKQFRAVFNSSLTVAYDKAGPGTDDDRASLSADVDGIQGAELRVIGKTVYAKAPVTELAQHFDVADADLRSNRRDATEASSAFGALFDGKWVSLDTEDAAKLPGDALFGVPSGQADSAKNLAEVKKSATNLFNGARITRDRDDPTHLVVTTSTTKAYAELKRLVGTLNTSKDFDLADEFGKAPKDRPIVIDLWIDHEKLTAAEVNLLQFIDGATGRAALRLEMTTGAPIEAPTGAAKIDPKVLSDLLPGPGAGVSIGADGSVGLGAASAGTSADPGGLSVKYPAEMLGLSAMGGPGYDGTPATRLKTMIDAGLQPGTTARLVRPGVAEVTAYGQTACLTVPTRNKADGEYHVTLGRCA